MEEGEQEEEAAKGAIRVVCIAYHQTSQALLAGMSSIRASRPSSPNGPLFALSRSLAARLTASDSPAKKWLHQFKSTSPVVAFARSHQRIPFKLKDIGCWPYGDATLGAWISMLSDDVRMKDPLPSVTLVNVPLMVSHHPYPTMAHGAFSNRSLGRHGRKAPNHDPGFWSCAKQRSSGSFEPTKGNAEGAVRRWGG